MKKLPMKKHHTCGMLLTFCGLDGCGKTTMIRRLADAMKAEGSSVSLTKQPTDFVRQSQIFRTFMDQPDHDAFDYRSLSLLAASDRIQHTNRVILPALHNGNIVVSDRYFYSCIANLRARGYTGDRWIYEVSGFVVQPDIAFFLDVPVDTAIGRVRSRDEEKDRYIDIPLQYRLRDEYLRLAHKNHGIILSTDRNEDETYDQIIRTIREYKRRNHHGDR